MGINSKYFTNLIDGDHPRDDLPEDIGYNGPDDIGYSDDTSITLIINYDFSKLECNEPLLSSMIDCYFNDDDSNIYDVIDTLVDDADLVDPDDDDRERIYNHLTDLVQQEYHNLRLAASPYTMRFIANGYYVTAAAPVSKFGGGTILTLDAVY